VKLYSRKLLITFEQSNDVIVMEARKIGRAESITLEYYSETIMDNSKA